MQLFDGACLIWTLLLPQLWQTVNYPTRYNALALCCLNCGPASLTLAHHWGSTGPLCHRHPDSSSRDKSHKISSITPRPVTSLNIKLSCPPVLSLFISGFLITRLSREALQTGSGGTYKDARALINWYMQSLVYSLVRLSNLIGVDGICGILRLIARLSLDHLHASSQDLQLITSLNYTAIKWLYYCRANVNCWVDSQKMNRCNVIQSLATLLSHETNTNYVQLIFF